MNKNSFENFSHFYPSEKEWEKYEKINSMAEKDWERECVYYDDCSICPMAIHTELISTTKHVCVRGMTKERFLSSMDSADAIF